MEIQFNNLKKHIILIPIVSILYYMITFLIDKSYWLYIIKNEHPIKESVCFLIVGLILSFIFIEASIYFGYLIFKLLHKISDTYYKIIVCSIFLFIANNVIAYLISYFLICIDYDEIPYFYQNLYIFGILVTFISGIYITNVYFDEYKRVEKIKNELEIKLLKEKQIKTDAELNILKQQIDPHFMFNSFSTLSELIIESPNVAEKFLEHLSKIYRHILQNMNNNLTSIKEELHLFHSYMYLMGIRYKESIILNVSPTLQEVTGYIPTASLQILAENAIKHNNLSPSCPLPISVYLAENYIVIENKLMPISSKLSSTKLGLKSIVDRYSILGDTLPIIQKTQEKFIVKLPIMQK